MNWKTKTGIIAAILLIVMTLAFIIKNQQDTIKRLQVIETSVTESKNIGDGIVRAQSSYVTKKDLETLMHEQQLNMEAIKKDMDTLGAHVTAVGTVHVSTPGYTGSNIQSTTITPRPDPPPAGTPVKDEYGYLTSTQWLTLTEPYGNGTEVPFGKAGFSAWQKKPWSVQVAPREYSSTTVLGENAEGRHYAYTRFQIKVDGKTYTIPITDSKIVEEYPTPSFSFNPRIYLGVDIGAIMNPPVHAEVTPSVGVSFFSYGQTKVSPEWSFLTLGLGYATQSKAGVLVLAPVNYNVGKHLPLMDNLHIGPAISIDLKGEVGLYVGARVAF